MHRRHPERPVVTGGAHQRDPLVDAGGRVGNVAELLVGTAAFDQHERQIVHGSGYLKVGHGLLAELQLLAMVVFQIAKQRAPEQCAALQEGVTGRFRNRERLNDRVPGGIDVVDQPSRR